MDHGLFKAGKICAKRGRSSLIQYMDQVIIAIKDDALIFKIDIEHLISDNALFFQFPHDMVEIISLAGTPRPNLALSIIC
jgi:hypothetical protein